MRQRGFTLIELAVAVFITAILFAIGFGAVNQAVKNKDALEQQQERLIAVQTAMRVIAQDVGQLAMRPIRDPTGNDWLPVVSAKADTNESWSSRAAAGRIRPACNGRHCSEWRMFCRTRRCGEITGLCSTPCSPRSRSSATFARASSPSPFATWT
ncbi:MAG: prepilin-type N-terminal cleavage/methylation domain-containing protein [Gammaproteobacteria bacterium]